MSLAPPHGARSHEAPLPGEPGPSPLTCQQAIGLFLDYLEDLLRPPVARELEQHLGRCAACRVYLRTYDRSRQLVGEVGRVVMPAELESRLRTWLVDRLGRGRR